MSMDDLDRILSTDRGIAPSSGFTDAVMRAVRYEAAAPPPIPFPWRRVLPIFAAAAALLIAVLVALPHRQSPPAFSIAVPDALMPLLTAFAALPLGPLTLALLGSVAAVRLSLRGASE